MSTRSGHLFEIAYLYIGSQNLRAHHQLDLLRGEFFLKLPDTFNRGVCGITDSENDFVFRIVLQAMASEALVDPRICPFQRFEDGDRRQILYRRCALFRARLVQKSPGAPETENVIEDARDAAKNWDVLQESEYAMDHARAELANSSLISQRFNRIEIRRLPCRIDAENQADARG